MSRRTRETPEINAGSMADIAFLLLIFFLVTTTMDQDTGILRLLPPPLDEEVEDPPIVKEKNVYEVLVNANDQLLVEGELMAISNLKDGAIEFLTNPTNSDKLPQKERITKALCNQQIAQIKSFIAQAPDRKDLKKDLEKWENKLQTVELIGEYRELPGSAIISLQNDNGTSYDMYIQVQNELQSAVNQLRDELSMEKFGKPYSELDANGGDDEKAKILAIRAVYPQRISEAEPKDTGN
ncbi:ExbD/TolR family protein [Luteibaculum oceani]|uniref:Biopolymer transporter ExbD n=1 Tax=Luteibaculum oceani TaxID=1294296 RepID=A0A5C6V349_9FLAO|nr:biopolymer transporter ExbD [Luteibaculum oceani]TXC78956.1 biopolymer transporter ExbD [Luteibaculum oceani]